MEKISASLILEILGRPKENVSAALQTVMEKLSQEKGVKILNKTLHEPMPVEKSDLFTSFAEVDVELDSIMAYLVVIFGHMPSNIQITEPEKITFNNIELNEIGNAIVQRLHHYDAVAKNVVVERNMYAKKLREVAPYLFKKPEAQAKEEKQIKNAKKPEVHVRAEKKPKKNKKSKKR